MKWWHSVPPVETVNDEGVVGLHECIVHSLVIACVARP